MAPRSSNQMMASKFWLKISLRNVDPTEWNEDLFRLQGNNILSFKMEINALLKERGGGGGGSRGKNATSNMYGHPEAENQMTYQDSSSWRSPTEC